MAVNYTALKATATRLISENGVSVTVSRTGSDSTWTKKYDPLTQRVYWEDGDSNIVYTAPGDTVTTYSGYAVLTDWPVKLIDGNVIRFDDLMVLISIEVELVPGDILTVSGDSREYKIVNPVEQIRPAQTPVLVQKVNARG